MTPKYLLISVATLALTLANAPAAPKDGDLVQNSKGSVCLIKDGKRCGIPSPAVFEANGFKWDAIVKLADADFDAIPAGPSVTAPVKDYTTPNNGDLVQNSKGSVCVIKDGKRCGIPSPAVFEANGYKWEKVIKITDASFDAIPEGPGLPVALKPYTKPNNGDLIQASSDGVFVIREGKRCGIPSPEVFNANHFKWENIIKISDADFDAIPEGPDVEAP